MIISNDSFSNTRLTHVKIHGKWRQSFRRVGSLYIEYEIDTNTKDVFASYGTFLKRSLVKPLFIKYDDYITTI